jgi:hypothetical protein
LGSPDRAPGKRWIDLAGDRGGGFLAAGGFTCTELLLAGLIGGCGEAYRGIAGRVSKFA